MQTKYPKPAACQGCPLEAIGTGFVRPSGPSRAPICLVGEAAGAEEVIFGSPFSGAAGGMLGKILMRGGWTRDQFRIGNVLQCMPPGLILREAWRAQAIDHCHVHRAPLLAEEHQVFVPLGAVALKTILGLWDHERIRVEDFHGTVHQTAEGQWVVPTWHPSHLQRGKPSLLDCVVFDLSVAHELAAGTWQRDLITPIIDPPVAWLRQALDGFYAAQDQDPDAVWGVVDIETPDKAKGRDEGELGEEDQSYQIQRVNLCWHPDEGITVPYDGPYVALVDEYLARCRTLLGVNLPYDLKRLLAAGHRIGASPDRIWDLMWLWHHLKPGHPRGLGHFAPFYSRHGAWKHLFSVAPGEYAAYDGPQTLRSGYGIVSNLVDNGQWYFAHRHTVRLLNEVLYPAQVVGIQVDRAELERFDVKLTTAAQARLATLQDLVPEDLRLQTPKGGFTRPPEPGSVHPKGRTTTLKGVPLADAEDLDPIKVALYATHARVIGRRVPAVVLCCTTCGAEDVQKRHRCKDEKGKPRKDVQPVVVPQDTQVARWFWLEPFNPDSPQQILAYFKARKFQPGRDKHTGNPSVDRETLAKYSSRDPVCATTLEYRAIGKVRGTYVRGVEKRLDPQDRFHPEPTLKPRTLRNSYQAPNIQNVVGDKVGADGKEPIAAGFRMCIVPGGMPADVTPEELAAWEARYGQD